MRVLLVSHGGDGIGLAFRWRRQGFDARVYIVLESHRAGGEGLVPQFTRFREALDWKPEVIFFDMTSHGDVADQLRRQGHKVVGASAFMDRIELDRKFGQAVLSKAKIPTLPQQSFTKLPDAIAFVQKTKKKYVVKPDGNQACDLTYVPQSPADLIRYLDYAEKKHLLKAGASFLLQEVMDGIEVSTEIWYSRGRPMRSANITLETKSFMPGNLGPLTGAQSSAVTAVDMDAPLVTQLHRPLWPILKQAEYTGPLDVNSIVDPAGRAWPLEFTPRAGFDAIYALSELLDVYLPDIFLEMAEGTAQELPLRRGWGVALRLSVPPSPMLDEDEHRDEFEKLTGLPIGGIKDLDHFWPLDARLDDGRLAVAGVDGVVGEFSAWGTSIRDGGRLVLAMAEAAEVANKQYRVDAFQVVEPAWRDLERQEMVRVRVAA